MAGREAQSQENLRPRVTLRVGKNNVGTEEPE